MTRSATDCLTWLLHSSRHLCAIRDVPSLSTAMVDDFIALCQGERGYLFLCGAGPKNLLLVAARGAGGLVAPPPDRRVMRVAERALSEPRSATIISLDGVARSAATVLMIDNEPQGLLYVDGTLDDAGCQNHLLDLYSQTAAVALDNARFFERASNDLLTGLPNHSYFSAALGKAIRKNTDADLASGLVLIDLDSFRRVNRAAGSDVGDRALIDVAHTLQDTLSADGLVARYGSDSFVVLLSAASKTAIHLRLRDVAERARAAVGAKIFGGVQLSACLGAAPLHDAAAGGVSAAVQATIAQCEALLTTAQRRGQGEIEVFMPATD